MSKINSVKPYLAMRKINCVKPYLAIGSNVCVMQRKRSSTQISHVSPRS